MAVLKNISSNIELHFILKKSNENEWLNYRVEVYVIDNNNLRKLLENVSLIEQGNLFLDALYDPEVLQLIKGINMILNGESDYFLFSPVDEKDFILEISREKNFYINFFRANALSNFWEGIRMTVDTIALEYFISELRNENIELHSPTQ